MVINHDQGYIHPRPTVGEKKEPKMEEKLGISNVEEKRHRNKHINWPGKTHANSIQ